MEQLERIIVEDFGAAWVDAYEATVRAFQVRREGGVGWVVCVCVWGEGGMVWVGWDRMDRPTGVSFWRRVLI